jgi:hypothetical protein
MKNNKFIILIILIILISGLGIGFFLNHYSQNQNNENSDLLNNKDSSSEQDQIVTIIKIQPTPTKVIPTVGPYTSIIIEKNESEMRIENIAIKGAIISVPKSTDKIKYFKRVNGQLIPITYDDLKVQDKLAIEPHPDLGSSDVIVE